MDVHASDSLEERLHRLERRSRLLAGGALMVAIVAGVWMLVGAANPPAAPAANPTHLDGQHLVIRDSAGRPRIEMSVTPAGAPCSSSATPTAGSAWASTSDPMARPGST